MVTCCGAQENKKTKGRKDKVVLTYPLVLPNYDEGAMVTCCGAQKNQRWEKGSNKGGNTIKYFFHVFSEYDLKNLEYVVQQDDFNGTVFQ
jgi:hypothetical protein